MLKIPLAGRIALLALLLACAPAGAQVNDDLSLETRTLLAALASAEEAADAFERALNLSDSATVAPDAARRLRQTALEGTVEAARAALILEMVVVLRADAGVETSHTSSEINLTVLLHDLQQYGDDLVEVEGCRPGAPPLDFAAVHGRVRPTLDRIRELGDLIGRQIQADLGRPEDRP